MPSIYSHENACWGIRKSCDMFQYDLSEEFQPNKLQAHGCSSDQNNAAPNTPYVHYSVSSNGYYGYQPHKVVHLESSPDQVEMDVDSIDTTPSAPQNNANRCVLACGAYNPDQHNLTAKRKRHMSNDVLDSSKRIRQEAEGQVKSLMQEHHQKEYFSHPKCLMAHFI